MQWEALGFKYNPLTTEPITQNTLELYTGHEAETRTCRNALYERNVALVIEGARGIGTTSFANYLRFVDKPPFLSPLLHEEPAKTLTILN